MSNKSRSGSTPFGDPAGSPSLIKAIPGRGFPSRWAENPIPPTDPKYRPAWEASMTASAKNWPDDPAYQAFRFRAGGG